MVVSSKKIRETSPKKYQVRKVEEKKNKIASIEQTIEEEGEKKSPWKTMIEGMSKKEATSIPKKSQPKIPKSPEIQNKKISRKIKEKKEKKILEEEETKEEEKTEEVEKGRRKEEGEDEKPRAALVSSPAPIISMSESLTLQKSQDSSLSPLKRHYLDLYEEGRKLKELPQLACSSCAIGPECPKFSEGQVCAFESSFSSFPSRDVDSVLALQAEIVEENKKRLRFAQLNERITSGGVLDPNVTRLSEILSKQVQGLLELHRQANAVTLKYEQSGNADSSKPSLLQKLFSSNSPDFSRIQPKTIDSAPQLNGHGSEKEG